MLTLDRLILQAFGLGDPADRRAPATTPMTAADWDIFIWRCDQVTSPDPQRVRVRPGPWPHAEAYAASLNL